MSARLMVLLGIAAIGAAIGIFGTVGPASADLLFGGGVNCSIVTPGVSCNPASPANFLGVNAANWSAPITGPVRAVGFNVVGPTPALLFVEGNMAAGSAGQSGIGIADASGGPDHEISPLNMVDISTPAAMAGQIVNATLSVDSLQTGEAFKWCAQPTAGLLGPECSTAPPIFGGTGPGAGPLQAIVPVTFGGANHFLAVTGTTVNGVIGDVKIEDFDVVPVSVPEPGTLALLLTGAAGLALARKRRNSI
jgi:PEP-CTERM motif-containing protein